MENSLVVMFLPLWEARVQARTQDPLLSRSVATLLTHSGLLSTFHSNIFPSHFETPPQAKEGSE